MGIRKRRPTDEEILAAVVELADDGFCERRRLAIRMRTFGERQLMKAIARAARRNLILERRGPDGRTYVALTSEGWSVHRELASGNCSRNPHERRIGTHGSSEA